MKGINLPKKVKKGNATFILIDDAVETDRVCNICGGIIGTYEYYYDYKRKICLNCALDKKMGCAVY